MQPFFVWKYVKDDEKEKKLKSINYLSWMVKALNVWKLFLLWFKHLAHGLDFCILLNIQFQETLIVKLESQNKGNIQLKQKYDELKAMNAAKDELITRVENEMREQSAFVDRAIKVLYTFSEL